MGRTIALYAAALAVCAVALQWLDTLVIGQRLSSQWHMAIIAVGFAVLGGWVATRLFQRAPHQPFSPNEAAITSLGLTPRECEVLGKLADGKSYKEIARDLNVSPNTIKTHVSKIYTKLDTDRRTLAIDRARKLSIIP